MRIAFAGPADLALLTPNLDGNAPPGRGYSAPIVSELARGLIERGHEVVVVTLSADPLDAGRYRGDRLELFVGTMRASGRARDAFRHERRVVRELLSSSEFDLVHAHWTYEFAMAAHEVTNRTVATVQDWWPAILRHHPHPYRVVRAGMQDRVLRSAPHLIANSSYTAEKITRWYRRDVPIIPNAVQLDPELSARGLINRDAPLIGSVNNGFGKLKNVKALIRAFGLLRSSVPGAKLRLVGSGFELGGPAEAYAVATTGTVGIEFVGPVPFDRVLEEMRSFDILMHPSLEESFGSTLIEAVAQGALVIGGENSGAVPWVLGQGRNGILVDVSDPRSICNGIEQVLAMDDGMVSERRNVAFEDIRTRFSMDTVLDLHESVYNTVIA